MIEQIHETAAVPAHPGTPRALLLKRAAIWAAFFVIVYLARNFFFTAFMTFVSSYTILSVVSAAMRRISPDHDRSILRKLITIGVFLLLLLATIGVGMVIAPRLFTQGQHLVGWLKYADPETELGRMLGDVIGSYKLEREPAAKPDDLDQFRRSGERHVEAYNRFPSLEAWLEGPFSEEFSRNETARIRSRLNREGTSSADFASWFTLKKLPQLRAASQSVDSPRSAPQSPVNAVIAALPDATPPELLEQIRRNPAALAALQTEWIDDATVQGLSAARSSPGYREQFRRNYEKRRAAAPTEIPYSFDQFVALRDARTRGSGAFASKFDELIPSAVADGTEKLKADFDAARREELFQKWWNNDTTARFIRRELDQVATGGATRAELMIESFLNVPIDLMTALLLSFFICIDFPRLQQGARRLRDTWLRDVYDEIAPALVRLGRLIALSMRAQGLIALCNAFIMFVALTLIGVEHQLLLSCAMFLLCLIPTLGAIMAGVLITVFALIQLGGGVMLALKAAAALAAVVAIESFFLSPRILGRMMELHPVLIIAILPIAQYFFGVWGLLLATPVAVYIMQTLVPPQDEPAADHLTLPPRHRP